MNAIDSTRRLLLMFTVGGCDDTGATGAGGAVGPTRRFARY